MNRRALFFLLTGLTLIFFSSCGGDPFKEYKDLEGRLVALEDHVKDLGGRNVSSEQIKEHLHACGMLITELGEGRSLYAREIDRLTKESYELNVKEIEKLDEGRLIMYNGLDDFLVCSYKLIDLIQSPVYYHDRTALESQIRELLLYTTAMIQNDPPLSNGEFSYYKNLSKITSQTADEDGSWYYTVEVNIGYNFNEKETQTMLNSSKLALGGIIRSYFSSMTKDYVQETDEGMIKAGLVQELNDYLRQFSYFKDKKMEGVKLVTFDLIQYYEFH